MSSACAARFRLGSVKLRGCGRGRRIALKAGSIKRAAPAVGRSLLHPRPGANPATIRRRVLCASRLAHTKQMFPGMAAEMMMAKLSRPCVLGRPPREI